LCPAKIKRSKDETKTFVRLGDFDAGDRLQVFVEPISGDLVPNIVLRAVGVKLLQTGKYVGDSRQTILDYTFPTEESSYQLDISASPGTSGDFRLLVSRNAPEVLTGEAVAQGIDVVLPPTEARIGIKL
jgi:hypothetical protein